MCYCSLLDSHGVQSGADNASCNPGQSRATPQCTPTLLSKQHVELFGGAENAGLENDGREIEGPICRA